MLVVLVEPEIPQNTGNISRTCVLTGTPLHLVEPLGFSLSQKELKRAGLDYWHYLQLQVHPDFKSARLALPGKRFIYLSTKGTACYSEISYRSEDVLVFGSETRGLPEEILRQGENVIRVPMITTVNRSLNLSNAVAIVLYEALRQQGFPKLR